MLTSIGNAVRDGILSALRTRPNNPFATIFLAGYLGAGAAPVLVMIRFFLAGGKLPLPEILIQNPPFGAHSGSSTVANLYLEADGQFSRYYRPRGTSLETGVRHVMGLIEACSDPIARVIDPFCESIGGRVHIATVTPNGFKWVRGYEPLGERAVRGQGDERARSGYNGD
jgi:hypothetical protein